MRDIEFNSNADMIWEEPQNVPAAVSTGFLEVVLKNAWGRPAVAFLLWVLVHSGPAQPSAVSSKASVPVAAPHKVHRLTAQMMGSSERWAVEGGHRMARQAAPGHQNGLESSWLAGTINLVWFGQNKYFNEMGRLWLRCSLLCFHFFFWKGCQINQS